MECQRQLFSLSDEIIYLNGAYMSPNLKAVEEAGIAAIKRLNNPGMHYTAADFFEPAIRVKQQFADLIKASDASKIAIIPSASYGLAIAAKNAGIEAGDEIVVISEQFPSNYYCWKHEADKVGAKIIIVSEPNSERRVQAWNNSILDAINKQTKVVTLPIIHWTDGSLFDIRSICTKAHEHGALVIIDGTQSIGAMPFDLAEIPVDALVCAAYKWLLGPYSIGAAYFGEAFSNGEPLENSWMTRKNAQDFAGLVNYEGEYAEGAAKFDMGQFANFNLLPMFEAGLQQLLEWTPEAISEYCHSLTKDGLKALSDRYDIEPESNRSSHLFGIRMKTQQEIIDIKQLLKTENISVSVRGQSIRVSPNVYNTQAEMDKLVDLLMNN